MKHFRLFILLSFFLSLFLSYPAPVQARGGVGGLFRRMDSMVAELRSAGRLSDDEVRQWDEIIQMLREEADERMKEEGSLNTLRDKDLYDEIDSYNKPLFEEYQAFKKHPSP